MRFNTSILLPLLAFLLSFQAGLAQDAPRVTPQQMDLEQVLNRQEVIFTVTVSNPAEKPLFIQEVNFKSGRLPYWEGPLFLSAAGSATFTFYYTPRRIGAINDTISLQTSQGELLLHLAGECIDPTDQNSPTANQVTYHYPSGERYETFELIEAVKGPFNALKAAAVNYTQWHKNGKISVKSVYNKGLHTQQRFRPDGTLIASYQFKGTFVTPNYTGNYTTYFTNGTKAALQQFKKGLTKGLKTTWYADGTLRTKAMFRVNAKTPYVSWFEAWYPSKKQLFSAFYTDKKNQHGLYNAWYESGQINAQYFNKRGKISLDRLFCEDGTVIKDLNRHQGKSFEADKTALSPACKATFSYLNFLPKY